MLPLPTGAVVFFHWDNDGTLAHIGLVEKCNNGTVYTVEDNLGDMCKQRLYIDGSKASMVMDSLQKTDKILTTK